MFYILFESDKIFSESKLLIIQVKWKKKTG